MFRNSAGSHMPLWACSSCFRSVDMISTDASHFACATAGSTTYRRQLKQDTVISFIADLISGEADGAGRSIAQLAANKDVAGIASALTNAASLVSLQACSRTALPRLVRDWARTALVVCHLCVRLIDLLLGEIRKYVSPLPDATVMVLEVTIMHLTDSSKAHAR